jgi:hypothetical protein
VNYERTYYITISSRWLILALGLNDTDLLGSAEQVFVSGPPVARLGTPVPRLLAPLVFGRLDSGFRTSKTKTLNSRVHAFYGYLAGLGGNPVSQ